MRARVAQQGNYLLPALPAGDGVCTVCRGPVAGAYPRCYECHNCRTRAEGTLADTVVPIAYAVKGEQHYQHLVAYKTRYPSRTAQTRLRELLPIPEIHVTGYRAYPTTDRAFHPDRFHVHVDHETLAAGTHVLVLDDTWTTGCRVQSLAHALTTAGAQSITAVTLGRLINRGWKPSSSLLTRARDTVFDIDRCCLPDCRHR